MSEVLEAGKFCTTHYKECGILHSSDCVFEAVPVKQKPIFTKEDVEKVELHIYSELLGWFGNDRDFDEDMAGELAKAALNAVGRVK